MRKQIKDGLGMSWAVVSSSLRPMSGKDEKACILSASLLTHPVLRKLDGLQLRYGTRRVHAPSDVFVGWGRKASGVAAKELATSEGKRCLLVEDGFLRSAGREDVPISMVVDDEGIYYDATTGSRFERLASRTFTAEELSRAAALRLAWIAEGVSKYNSGRTYEGSLPDEYVLVVDQVAGDESISCGTATPQSFEAMLAAALEENPDLPVVVKVHPDRATRGQAGHFRLSELALNSRIVVVSDPCHPVSLVRKASKVYAVTSQMGFEALLHGVPVRCFGMPFYAGWGLTEDECIAPSRRQPIALEALVHAALIDYAIYVDPLSGKMMAAEDAVAWMGAVRRLVERTPELLYAVGFSAWKRPILRRMCRYSKVVFCNPEHVPSGATVAVWSVKSPIGLPADVQLLRIEDGFLRSKGLGADLTQPYSWCLDPRGMHFSPKGASWIEDLLEGGDIAPCHLERAAKIRACLLEAGISKYNLTGETWSRPEGRQVILAAGQVEDDASIREGSPKIRRNIDLVRSARAKHPDAWIVYKPHPDVVSGLRIADAEAEEIRNIADEVVSDVGISDLLKQVDGVHVMTSQTGFEAMLRGISVTCEGIPFYAGWGLTEDRLTSPRRSRTREVDAVVAAALILYPTYSDPKTGLPITPEQTIDLLTRDPGSQRGRSIIRRVRRFRTGLRQ